MGDGENMSPFRAVIGRGNPGREYAFTRHNLGFMVVDLICERHRSKFKAGKGPYLESTIAMGNENILLAKPTTYMNQSGRAVSDILKKYGFSPFEFLVVCDDLALPVGTVRLRPRGSDGSHKGLRSIIYQLESEDFPRLRLGIGAAPEGTPAEEHVLSKFHNDEIEIVEEMLKSAADAIETAVRSGLEAAMNRFNIKANDKAAGSGQEGESPAKTES